MSTESNTQKKSGIVKRKIQSCRLCDAKFRDDRSRCPSCGAWNTCASDNLGDNDGTVLLSEAAGSIPECIPTGIWDKVFSDYGGIPVVSTILIGGEPGAGKSTLSLMLADRIAAHTLRTVMYVGKEEAVEAIKARAIRLGLENLHLIRIYPIGCETDIRLILKKYHPSALFIDSVPGVSDAESAGQMVNTLKQEFAIPMRMPVLFIDHVTKEKQLAGKMDLQHYVDTTTMLTKYSSDPDTPIRLFRSEKNRFGPQAQVVLNMVEKGLVLYEMSEDEYEGD